MSLSAPTTVPASVFPPHPSIGIYVCKSNNRHCWHGHSYRRIVRYRTPSWAYLFFSLDVTLPASVATLASSSSSSCPSTPLTPRVLSHRGLSIGLFLLALLLFCLDLLHLPFMLQAILAIGNSAPRSLTLELRPSRIVVPSESLQFTSRMLV